MKKLLPQVIHVKEINNYNSNENSKKLTKKSLSSSTNTKLIDILSTNKDIISTISFSKKSSLISLLGTSTFSNLDTLYILEDLLR